MWLRAGGGRRASRASNSRREREVRFRAARFHVVEDGRHAVARRFAEPDVARDDGLNTRSLKNSRMSFATCWPRLVRSSYIVISTPAMSSVGVQRGADAAQRRDEIGEPLEREVFAVERNQHGVGGDERVEREQAERRRRVDEDVVEAVAQRLEEMAQAPLAIGQRDELDFRAGEIAVGGNEPEILDRRFRG